MAVLGSEPLSAGFNMVAAHARCPQSGLETKSLYEDKSSATACMRTHYYGGIKNINGLHPLALYGTIIKSDGSIINISIGERRRTCIYYS